MPEPKKTRKKKFRPYVAEQCKKEYKLDPKPCRVENVQQAEPHILAIATQNYLDLDCTEHVLWACNIFNEIVNANHHKCQHMVSIITDQN